MISPPSGRADPAPEWGEVQGGGAPAAVLADEQGEVISLAASGGVG